MWKQSRSLNTFQMLCTCRDTLCQVTPVHTVGSSSPSKLFSTDLCLQRLLKFRAVMLFSAVHVVEGSPSLYLSHRQKHSIWQTNRNSSLGMSSPLIISANHGQRKGSCLFPWLNQQGSYFNHFIHNYRCIQVLRRANDSLLVPEGISATKNKKCIFDIK